MMNARLNKLLSQLTEGRYINTKTLCEKLSVSERTLHNQMKELKDWLDANGASVVTKYGAGYAIAVHERSTYEEFLASLNRWIKQTLPATSAERTQYLLEYFMNEPDYIKLDDLSEKLFITKKTLSAEIKEIEQILEDYQLRLERKPGYGVRLVGDEYHVRMLFAQVVAQQGRLKFVRPAGVDAAEKYAVIQAITQQVLANHDFPISQMAFQNLTMHLFIALHRLLDGNTLPEGTVEKTLYSADEYAVAQALGAGAGEHYGVIFSAAEVGYIALHLAGKRIYPESDASDNIVINQEISDLVSDMLEHVRAVFHYDFRDDLELRMALSLHLIPLEVRIRADMKLRNPLLQDIKEHYTLAYAIASQACISINQKFGKEVKEDEVGYIAFSFALALERRRSQRSRKNILLVCSTGKGSARLLLYKIQMEFQDQIESITTCDLQQLRHTDLHDIDYIFTTVPIPFYVSRPIQEVHYFLEERDFNSMRRILQSGRDSFMSQYFDERLFLSDLDCTSKDKVLATLCRRAISVKGLPEAFYQSVLRRESLAKTDFGNLVAMPHPMESMSEDTFVCVGILRHPIFWGGQEVQVVLLVSIGKKSTDDLQRFYQVLAKFLLSRHYVSDLMKYKDFNRLKQQLNTIAEEAEEVK